MPELPVSEEDKLLSNKEDKEEVTKPDVTDVVNLDTSRVLALKLRSVDNKVDTKRVDTAVDSEVGSREVLLRRLATPVVV